MKSTLNGPKAITRQIRLLGELELQIIVLHGRWRDDARIVIIRKKTLAELTNPNKPWKKVTKVMKIENLSLGEGGRHFKPLRRNDESYREWFRRNSTALSSIDFGTTPDEFILDKINQELVKMPTC